MNKIWLIGRLTRDVDLKRTASGHYFSPFNLAVKRKYKAKDGEENVDFFSCVAWNGHAKTMYQFLNKGSLVAVEGRLEKVKYTDSEGKKRTTDQVVVENVTFLETKAETIARKEKTKIVSTEQVQPEFDFLAEDLPF